MLDELRDRIISFVSQSRVCVVSASGSLGVAAVIAQYHCCGLEMDCLLPRWTDVIYHLEQNPVAVVIVLDAQSNGSRWLQYRGIAHVNPPADQDLEDRYVSVHLTPERVDLHDGSHGWGSRETLEL